MAAMSTAHLVPSALRSSRSTLVMTRLGPAVLFRGRQDKVQLFGRQLAGRKSWTEGQSLQGGLLLTGKWEDILLPGDTQVPFVFRPVAGRSGPGKHSKHTAAQTSATSPSALGLAAMLMGGGSSNEAPGSSASYSYGAIATELHIPDELDVYRGLVLDTAYRPINVVCWKRALCLDILAKADVLEYYDHVVKSPNAAWPIPAVLRVSHFLHAPKERKRRLSLSRNNVFLRDNFKCQYCGSKDELTIDHVTALSRGGGSSWENLVTACATCNLKKGDRSPAECGMKLAKVPKEPKDLDLRSLPQDYKTFRSLKRSSRTPAEWLDWLPLKPPQIGS